MDKNIIITGASSDIGREIALRFKGSNLILLGRSENKLSKILKLNQGKGEAIITDLSNAKSVQNSINKIKRKYDHIDMIIYVAGIYHSKNNAYYNTDYGNYSQKIVNETMNVGLLAPMMLYHQLVDIMPKYSKIINLSGTFDSGAKGWLPYYMSKKGIEDLTIGLSQELTDKHIQVNCISPSDTLTSTYKKFFPEYAKENTCVKVGDIADLATFLAKSDSINGQIITVKKANSNY